MWVLFLLLITSPGQYEVQVLEQYPIAESEKVCKSEAARLASEFKKTYTQANDKDTYAFVCVKQKEKEA
jgi:hypothetical protein